MLDILLYHNSPFFVWILSDSFGVSCVSSHGRPGQEVVLELQQLREQVKEIKEVGEAWRLYPLVSTSDTWSNIV